MARGARLLSHASSGVSATRRLIARPHPGAHAVPSASPGAPAPFKSSTCTVSTMTSFPSESCFKYSCSSVHAGRKPKSASARSKAMLHARGASFNLNPGRSMRNTSVLPSKSEYPGNFCSNGTAPGGTVKDTSRWISPSILASSLYGSPLRKAGKLQSGFATNQQNEGRMGISSLLYRNCTTIDHNAP